MKIPLLKYQMLFGRLLDTHDLSSGSSFRVGMTRCFEA